ncbi:MAG: hypothetical protein AAFQ02_01585 [Bacteroidota bacterium]
MMNLYHLALFILSFATSTFAQYSIEWTGAKNQLWNEAGNWDEGRVPNADDYVVIRTGDTVVVKATPPEINRIDILSSSRLEIFQDVEFVVSQSEGDEGVRISLGGSLHNDGVLRVIEMTGTAISVGSAGALDNHGEIYIADIVGRGINTEEGLTNHDALIFIKDLQGRGINTLDTLINHGEIRIEDLSENPDPSVIAEAGIFLSGFFENEGRIEISDVQDGVPAIDNRSTIQNLGEIRIARSASGLRSIGNILNTDLILLSKSTLSSSGHVHNTTDARLSLTNSFSGINNTGSIVNDGTISIDSSTNSALTSSGLIINNDSIYFSRINSTAVFNRDTIINSPGATIEISKTRVNAITNTSEGAYIVNRGNLSIEDCGNVAVSNNTRIDNAGSIQIQRVSATALSNVRDFVTFAGSTLNIKDSERGITNNGGFVHGGSALIEDCSIQGLSNGGTFIINGPGQNAGVPLANFLIRNVQGTIPFQSFGDGTIEVWGDFSVE